jgi:membrane protease YdiL (CAAX protease family)
MSAVSRRTPAQIDRLARLQTFGGWMLAVGLLIAMACAGAIALSSAAPAAVLSGRAPLTTGSAVLLLAAAAGGLIAILGLGLFLVVPGLDAQLARRGYDRLPTILACLTGVFVLSNVLSLPAVLGQAVDRAGRQATALPIPSLVAALLATQLSIMAVLIWRVIRPGALTWDDIGLTTSHLDRRLVQGAVGGLGIFLLAGATGIAMRQLIGVEQTQSQLFEGIRGATQVQFFSFWLAAAVVAPICEETFFRGYVFTALRGRYGRLVAYPLSALLFSAIHFNLPALVPILVMAIGLAFLYDRSGSVVPGIVAHALNNSVALTLLYAGLRT